MSPYLTAAEDTCLNLIFEYVDEPRFNRSMEEYEAIAKRLPPLKVLHGYINDRLQELAQRDDFTVRVCHFKPGDRTARYEPCPISVSLETVRRAEVKSGLRDLRPGKSKKPLEILELYFPG